MATTEKMTHPRGLYSLFFTEMWERFSYYGMRALFVLYLTSLSTGDNPGLGWTDVDAFKLYAATMEKAGYPYIIIKFKAPLIRRLIKYYGFEVIPPSTIISVPVM